MASYILLRNGVNIGTYSDKQIKANWAWFKWALTTKTAYYTLKKMESLK